MEETKKEGEGKEGTAKEGKEGVTAHVIRDEKTGRWLPGSSPNPLGRPTAKAERLVISAINARMHPELVADVLYEGLHSEQWRERMACLEWYGKYMLGPATTRTPESENVIDVILAKMRDARG